MTRQLAGAAVLGSQNYPLYTFSDDDQGVKMDVYSKVYCISMIDGT